MPTLDARTLEERAHDDPWELSAAERREILARRAERCAAWHEALVELVPPLATQAEMPWFLLDEGSFASLGEELRRSQAREGRILRTDLDPLVHDRFERFVELFAAWSTGAAPARPSGPAAGSALRAGERR
jgi:hypothetical protein